LPLFLTFLHSILVVPWFLTLSLSILVFPYSYLILFNSTLSSILLYLIHFH
jgi:hypothetical protein